MGASVSSDLASLSEQQFESREVGVHRCGLVYRIDARCRGLGPDRTKLNIGFASV